MTGFPMPRGCPYHPPAGYGELGGPLAKVTLLSGQEAWVVTGYAEARALFADPRLSADRADPHYPELTGRRADPEAIRAVRTFVEMDQPEHGEHRRMAIPSFSLRRIRALRPRIEQAVESLLDQIVAAGPPADLVESLAFDVPAFLLAELFGVPAADRPAFTAAVKEKNGAGLPTLARYFDRLAATKEPGDDLLSALRARDELDRRQLINLAMMIVVAGSETTANVIGLGTLALLDHPAQQAKLRADPAAAVEELLRYVSIADTIPRVAIADIEIGGKTILAGEGVVLSTAAANRDEQAFPAPDELDLGRAARHHVAFGYGLHQCLGQNLARTALEVVFTRLFDRLPGLSLAVPAEELPIKGAVGLQGVTALPVTW
ncbi:cytochrome P450 [Kribbella catacumbae]|uniref:cytochrome P450 n=1 Tax=Kribbella catacumbae TaxID=460086 RepID=UPI00036056A9|nr:cytochrome P450 [Kribbella catacumbae]